MGSFGNDTARNVLIFGVDNRSSSYVENRKSNFLILGLGPIFGINGSFGSPEKKVIINFNKANTKFCLSDGFSATEFRKVSLNGNVYDFSADYNSADKSDI